MSRSHKHTASQPSPSQPPWRWSARQCVLDSAYLFLAWPALLTGFVVVVTLLAVGLPLSLVWVGIPVVVAGLGAAHVSAQVEHGLQRALLGRPLPDEPANAPDPQLRHRVLAELRNPVRAGELAHALLGWLPATLAWSVTVSWWATTGGLLSSPWWVRALGNERGADAATLLHLPDTVLAHDGANVTVGAVLLVLTPWAMRALALAQAHACTLLLELPVRPLRAAAAELEQRRRLAASQSAEASALRRLERDIHDGPQQRIVRLQLDLARAERAADDQAKAREILAGARVTAQGALDELRATTRGIAPQVLAQHGLAAACEEIAGRCPVPLRVDVQLPRLSPAVETALYYLVSEATTNAAKHSGAREVRVIGRLENARAVVRVVDDGRGGAHPGKGTGLTGLEQRLAAVGGRLTVTSPQGGPTTIEGDLPCAS